MAFFVTRPAHFETPWQFWFTLVLFALTNVVLFFEELKVLRLPRAEKLLQKSTGVASSVVGPYVGSIG